MEFIAHPFWFWLSIVMMVDAAIGLLGVDFWQRVVPNLNVRRWALIEAAAAILLMFLHISMNGMQL